MKPLDIGAITLSLAVTLAFTVRLFSASTGTPEVEIQASGTTYLYAMDRDQELDFEGPIGITHVSINNGKVRVVSSPCRDKICVNAGWLNAYPDWTACLPNRLILRVVAGEPEQGTPDAVSF